MLEKTNLSTLEEFAYKHFHYIYTNTYILINRNLLLIEILDTFNDNLLFYVRMFPKPIYYKGIIKLAINISKYVRLFILYNFSKNVKNILICCKQLICV